MARKPKQNEEQKPDTAQLLDEPAGEAVAGNEPLKIEWPQSTAMRELSVTLTDEEAHEQALIIFREMGHAESLKQEKKATAKEFDSKIEAVEKEIAELIGIVREKKLRREVPCRWIFEAHGLDADGAPKHHSGMKTLVRDDTGEAVEVSPITQDDRQMVLPIGDEEAHGLNVGRLAELGYTVEETPDDIEHTASFQAVNAGRGHTLPIHADSLAEAAAAAVAELEQAAPAPEILEAEIAPAA
ncbi:MAG: hypothetical protein V4726_07210 [Verrucomicrobiota bacterium]